MSHALEQDATKFFLAKSIDGAPKVKKHAVRFVDQLSSFFILHLDKVVADVSRGKSITPEDIIKALKENGLEEYVSAFKEAMKEEPKEATEADLPKKKREKSQEKEKKAKKE